MNPSLYNMDRCSISTAIINTHYHLPCTIYQWTTNTHYHLACTIYQWTTWHSGAMVHITYISNHLGGFQKSYRQQPLQNLTSTDLRASWQQSSNHTSRPSTRIMMNLFIEFIRKLPSLTTNYYCFSGSNQKISQPGINQEYFGIW